MTESQESTRRGRPPKAGPRVVMIWDKQRVGRVPRLKARIARALQAQGLTQDDLATTMGVHVATVQRLLDAPDVDLDQLVSLCQATGLSLEDVLVRETEQAS